MGASEEIGSSTSDSEEEQSPPRPRDHRVTASPSLPVPASPSLPVPPSPNLPVTSFPRQVAWTFGTRVLMLINSVVAGVVVARWLEAKGVGELAVINVTIFTLVQLGSFGLPSANTYFIAQSKKRLGSAVANSLLFALIFGSALAFGLSFLAYRRPDLFVSPQLIRIAAVAIPFQLITLIGLNVLLAVGRIKEFNLLDLASQSMVLINAVAALVILSGGLSALVIMNAGGTILVSLIVVVVIALVGSKLLTKWTPDFELLRKMLRYGVKFHISILAGALIFRADLLVVSHFRGPDEVGVYSVATQVGMMLILLPAVIATLLFPRITAVPDPRGETTCLVTRHTAFIMILCCLAIVPLSALIPVGLRCVIRRRDNPAVDSLARSVLHRA